MKVLTTPVTLPGDARADPTLCLYESETRDIWQGYVVGRRGWNGSGLLPSPPGLSVPEALQNWSQQLDLRSKVR